MAEIDVLKAQIVRQDLSTPWGFRLQGGVDQGEPLHINRLTPGSPAARIGLKAGDEVTEVGDIQTEGLTYQQALDMIGQYGESLVLTVERRAKGSIPPNPVLGIETEPLKRYQTYDMTGSKPGRPAPTYTQVTMQPPDVRADDGHVFTAGPILVTGAQAKPVPIEEPKFYQTYDLNGPRAQVPSNPKHDYQFQRVTARPFEEPPKPYYSPLQPEPQPPPPPPQPQPQPQTPPLSPPHQHYSPPPQQQYSPSPYNYNTPEYKSPDYMGQDYNSPDYTDRDDGVSQSRTFRVLQSLMSSEEPAAGVQGLPPPRSVSQEQWKAEQAAKRSGPRVKVFMPQQYNSPLGMYSAKNVVETFQAQAETMMDAMDNRQGNNHLSDVQKAIQESN